jgi:DNA-nicking Smr family endonuclease
MGLDALLDARPVATLDLHGFRATEIEQAVRNFLSTWQRRAPGSVVHVITGRGKGSRTHPVVRPAVRRFLESGGQVLVREWSPDVDSGGYLVRLR